MIILDSFIPSFPQIPGLEFLLLISPIMSHAAAACIAVDQLTYFHRSRDVGGAVVVAASALGQLLTNTTGMIAQAVFQNANKSYW